MSENANILIDLLKIKNIHSGLGQFCYHLGQSFSVLSFSSQLTYLIPFEKQSGFPHFQGDFLFPNLKMRYFPKLNEKFSLWHATHQDSNYLPNSFTPYLLTIHDLNFLYEKSTKKAKKRLQLLQKKVDRATKITTISHFTAQEIKKHLVLKNKDLEVIYNGLHIFSHTSQEIILKDKRPFLLALAMVLPKKNFHTLVKMMEYLPDYQLIIAGNKQSNYAQNIEKKILDLKDTTQVTLLGEVTENQKKWLLENCHAFCFPSKYEGFGLPILEAMYYQKPVFLSTFTALPEIGKDYAYYWQNFEPFYMANLLKDGLKDFENQQNKKILQQNYAKTYNWLDTAKNYLKIYETFL